MLKELLDQSESIKDINHFFEDEKKKLIEDGAVIYELAGDTIGRQQESGRKFWYVTNGGQQLLQLPSLRTEVAIYPDPERFFVPKSGGKDLETIKALLREDAKNLRMRLKLDRIDEIVPNEASTLTELFFKHADKTGVLLFGSEFGFLYGITNNPINDQATRVANVGSADVEHGLCIRGWFHEVGNAHVHVVRLVVPGH